MRTHICVLIEKYRAYRQARRDAKRFAPRPLEPTYLEREATESADLQRQLEIARRTVVRQIHTEVELQRRLAQLSQFEPLTLVMITTLVRHELRAEEDGLGPQDQTPYVCLEARVGMGAKHPYWQHRLEVPETIVRFTPREELTEHLLEMLVTAFRAHLCLHWGREVERAVTEARALLPHP